jgi:DNA-3-methyladenine glycosylase
VARGLLGATLVSEVGGLRVAVRLTEVEAYGGAADAGSHAYRGRTPRTDVMFGPAGVLYVYFTYGMHWCANVVCGPEGDASAVLLRAGEVFDGLDLARERRPAARSDRDLARGPARLAAALGLDGSHLGIDLLDARQPVRLAGVLGSVAPDDVANGPRVGLTKAAETPWRFWIRDDPTVSPYRSGARGRGGSPA